MPDVDVIYDSEGYARCASRCRIRIFRREGRPPVVIASDEADANPGTSITNAAEELATDVARVYGLAGEPFVWIEHYDDRANPTAARLRTFGSDKGESFDLVEFRAQGTTLRSPEWTPIPKSEVQELIGEVLP